MLKIAVIGASSCDNTTYEAAYQVGQEIAKHRGILFCGGMGGVMEAAAKGAKSRDGVTIGILPTLHAQDANAYIDFPICTGISHARNLSVVASADAVIAVGGAYGTLSEIAFALNLNRPVVCLNSWELDAPLIHATSPAEAIEKVISFLRS